MANRGGTKSQQHILIVDDEPTIRETLAEYLIQEGYSVTSCASGERAVDLCGRQKFDVVLCDVNLPGLDGLDVLERLGGFRNDTLVLLITAYATVETAIEAFQKGAFDYLIKPISLSELSAKLQRLVQHRELHRENQQLRLQLNQSADVADFQTVRNPAMMQVMSLARKVAPTQSTLLILGESGTGKDVLSRQIHAMSQHAQATNGRYVPINCAAIPSELIESQLFGHRKGSFTGADRDTPGIFVYAGRGTVFLDEVAELPLVMQAKLLRVIEQKEVQPVGSGEPVKVQARILAATNKNLESEVQAGRFRSDLFFRLNVVAVSLPPLRERMEDLAELIQFLLAKQSRAAGKPFVTVEPEALRCLMAHRWPGNIRELDNALQRAVILGEPPTLRAEDLPPSLRPIQGTTEDVDNLHEASMRFEKQHLIRVLSECPEKRLAARRLGIGLSSLYRKIEEHGLFLDEKAS